MTKFKFNEEDRKKIEKAFDKALKELEKNCPHNYVIKEEHLTGEGSMEYVEWYDNTCPDCGKKWTSND